MRIRVKRNLCCACIWIAPPPFRSQAVCLCWGLRDSLRDALRRVRRVLARFAHRLRGRRGGRPC
jgi:hypothetical protein